MQNRQVLIDNLPEGKLRESDYKIVSSELPDVKHDEVLIKTISFGDYCWTRAGPRKCKLCWCS